MANQNRDDQPGIDGLIKFMEEKRRKLRAMVGEDLLNEALRRQKAGEFTEVNKFVTEPFEGHHFEVKRGQTFRFELIDGPQILDIMFLNKQHPTLEFFGHYGSTAIEGMPPSEGQILMSVNPYWRPMAVLLRDNVDRKRIEAALGKEGQHMIMAYNARCSEGINEWMTDIPNTNSCNNNLHDALNRIGGETLMRAHVTPQIFAVFQPNIWFLQEGGRPLMAYIGGESQNIFRRGDYVEVFALQDMYVALSMCPFGDQSNMEDITKNRSWPVQVKVFDTGLDVPELETRKSLHVVDFVKQGRPGMKRFEYGVPGGPGSFS